MYDHLNLPLTFLSYIRAHGPLVCLLEKYHGALVLLNISFPRNSGECRPK